MAAKKFLKRIVKGPKPLHHADPRTGKRYIAQPGEEVEVLSQQAVSKAHLLIDPRVAEAEAAAEEAAAASVDNEGAAEGIVGVDS